MGYSAEFYEPIARGIDNLNKQMNINSDRADDREARGMKQLFMASQLQTQQEDRGFARRSAENNDRRLEEAIKSNDFARKQSLLQDKREAATFKQRQEGFALENEKRKAEMQEIKASITPVQININEQLGITTQRGQDILSDPRSVALIESIHGNNVKYNPSTGLLTNKKTGVPVKMSPRQYDLQFASKLFNLPFVITDPAAMIRGDVAEHTKQLNTVKAKLKTVSNSKNKNVDMRIAASAKLKAKINSIESKIQKANNVSTQKMIEGYKERGKRLTQFAIANQYNPELLKQVATAQSQNEAMLDRLYRKQNAEIKAAADTLKTNSKNVVNKTLKELRSSYEMREKIRVNAIKNIDPLIEDYNEHVERIEDEAYSQKMIIAREYMRQDGNPSDLGATKEEVEAFDEQAEVEKWKPSNKETKKALSGKVKYTTVPDIKAALDRGELPGGEEEALTLIMELSND